jgi:uncharacterized ferredoxin-like protein
MDQKTIFIEAWQHVAQLCAKAAITVPKSSGRLFFKGSEPFIETIVVEDRKTLSRLAESLLERGNMLKDPIWFREVDTAKKLDLGLFIGLAKWYPQVYDCEPYGYNTCAEFLCAREHVKIEGSDDWEFPGPICQMRIAAALRQLGIFEADLAVALSMSVSHKNIFFDKKMPEVKFDD